MIGPHTIVQAAIFVVHSMVVAIRCVNTFALIHVNSLTINVNKSPRDEPLSVHNASESDNICRYEGRYQLTDVETKDTHGPVYLDLTEMPFWPFVGCSICVGLTQDALALEEERISVKQKQLRRHKRSLRQIWSRVWVQNHDNCQPNEEPKVNPIFHKGRYLLKTTLDVGNGLQGQFVVSKWMGGDNPLSCQIEATGPFGSTLMLPTEDISARLVEKAVSEILPTCSQAELLSEGNLLVLRGQQGILYFRRLKYE